MNTSINLAQKNSGSTKKKKQYTPYIYGMFVGVIAIAMGIMVINIVLKVQHGSLSDTANELITQINNQADKKVKMQVISERSKNIQSLLVARGNLNERFATLVEQFPNSVNITSLDMKEKEVVLTLESPSLLVMNGILERDLPNFLQENNSNVTRVDINTFTAQEGRYAVTLKLEYEGGNQDE